MSPVYVAHPIEAHIVLRVRIVDTVSVISALTTQPSIAIANYDTIIVFVEVTQTLVCDGLIAAVLFIILGITAAHLAAALSRQANDILTGLVTFLDAVGAVAFFYQVVDAATVIWVTAPLRLVFPISVIINAAIGWIETFHRVAHAGASAVAGSEFGGAIIPIVTSRTLGRGAIMAASSIAFRVGSDVAHRWCRPRAFLVGAAFWRGDFLAVAVNAVLGL